MSPRGPFIPAPALSAFSVNKCNYLIQAQIVPICQQEFWHLWSIVRPVTVLQVVVEARFPIYNHGIFYRPK